MLKETGFLPRLICVLDMSTDCFSLEEPSSFDIAIPHAIFNHRRFEHLALLHVPKISNNCLLVRAAPMLWNFHQSAHRNWLNRTVQYSSIMSTSLQCPPMLRQRPHGIEMRRLFVITWAHHSPLSLQLADHWFNSNTVPFLPQIGGDCIASLA